MNAPTLFEQCHAALMVHEVGADPLDPKCWIGGVVGVGSFIAPNGGLDLDAQDPGNWTGGNTGIGELGGTRWGIDTASYQDGLKHLPATLRPSYPALVRDLTFPQARELTRYAYWLLVRGDDLAPPVALLTLDAAFNNGVETGSRWLQAAVGAIADGAIGDKTIKAATQAVLLFGAQDVAVEVLAARMNYMGRLTNWQTFGLGWSRRLALLPFQAMRLI
jgi:lysozyme family protein